ncbi:MAG: SulP family inorganic anion transporter [Leptospirillia bacterium]
MERPEAGKVSVLTLIHGFSLRFIRGDIFGGLTSAVVALPLALAFGVASGAGPIAGLYGAIFVGLFAALFGGTPAQVSGPTGPMTVVMAAVFVQYANDPAMAFTVVMLGGVFQILFGALGLGRYVSYLPFPVISGVMTAIGVIIIALQVAPFAGFENPAGGVLMTLVALPGMLSHPQWQAMALGATALSILIWTPEFVRRWVPPPLVALIIGSLGAAHLFPEVAVIGEIPRGLPTLHLPSFDLHKLPGILRSALALAILGSIDSLLTSLIADNITRTHHAPNRELVGQGIGNLVAGIMGGIPGAGATMRTVVNVRAGGRTPFSGALHSLVLLSLVVGLAPLVEHIPMAVLAGILLKVGWDIVDWDYLRLMRHAQAEGVMVMVTVFLLTVFIDLITAVGLGIILTALLSAQRLSEAQLAQMKLADSETEAVPLNDTERALMTQAAGQILLLHMSGPFSFCSAKDMVKRMASLGSHYRVAVVDLTDVVTVDTSIIMAIREMFRQMQDRGMPVFVSGLGSPAVRELVRMKVLDMLPQGQCHRDRETALRDAVKYLDEPPGDKP